MSMRGSSDHFCVDRFMLNRMGCSCSLWTYHRYGSVMTDDIGQRDGTNTDYSVQIVPEGFSPLDNRQSLGYHWYIWFVATFLVFQSFPLLREILHDWRPLKVSSSDGTVDGIVEPKKLGRHNQSLLGLGLKCKGWCRNLGTCSRSGVKISYPSRRAS